MIVFFEDNEHRHFYPLALTRPADDLRTGILKIHEKWLYFLGDASFTRTIRPFLKPVFGSPVLDNSEEFLWINALFLPDKDVADEIMNLKAGSGLKSGDRVVAARLPADKSRELLKNTDPDLSFVSCKTTASGFLLTRIWELFQRNALEIESDFELLGGGNQSSIFKPSGRFVVNPGNIFIGEDVTIEAGTVIDASGGPVYIGSKAVIMCGSIIKGPAAVCDGSVLKIGAKIYPETTIGPVCKVGGEVKNAVFQGYSNKAHEGFLGNSLIGEWCNLGADTNSSNLKNNYKPIFLKEWDTGQPYETGLQYCGTIMGDHTKTGINSMLGTGTMCGVACNLFGNGYTPSFIPSFTWINNGEQEIHRFDKAMETAERVVSRRNVNLSDGYREMMRNIFENRRHPSEATGANGKIDKPARQRTSG